MALNPIRAWDGRVLPVLESTFGTPPDPTAAQYLEVVSINMGPQSSGVIRDKRDRGLGRAMRNDWVEGRKMLLPWSLETSLKGRAAVDAVPAEDALYQAAGMLRTVNASTSVVYSMQGTPTPQGLTIDTVRGTGLAAQLGERGYGGAVEQLTWRGGNSELALVASGKFIDKETRGKLDSITVTNVATSLTITAEESYRLGLGYYLCESEIIRVTAVTPGSTTATILRAQLASSAVAHTAQPLVPYVPTLSNPAGRPLGEGICTFTVDGVAMRVTQWELSFDTGIEHLPGETGSQRVQGLKVTRYNPKLTAKGVLYEDYVSILGRSPARRNCAVTIVQGAGAGRIATFSLPFTEVEPVPVGDSRDDVALVDLSWRVRDNAGNDALTLTLT